MICSQHFDASCFVQPSKEKSLFYSQKRLKKLRPDTIPTLRLMVDEPQVEAVHCDKRSLPLIDTLDMLESACNDTSTLESKCDDTVLPHLIIYLCHKKFSRLTILQRYHLHQRMLLLFWKNCELQINV